MESWNVVSTTNPREFLLLNGSGTVFKMAGRVTVDLGKMLSRMEESKVPLKYTEFLEEVYFCHLRNVDGDYIDSKMRLCGTKDYEDMLPQIFVHELGHHVDDREDISGLESIIAEQKEGWRTLGDTYARKNVMEYVSVGFEVFYFGSKKRKTKMKSCNPQLYKAISSAHKKYASK